MEVPIYLCQARACVTVRRMSATAIWCSAQSQRVVPDTANREAEADTDKKCDAGALLRPLVKARVVVVALRLRRCSFSFFCPCGTL